MDINRLKKRFGTCEDGGSLLVLFPGLMLVIFVMFALTANYQLWNGQKNEMQLIADSMSRAGACSINKTQAVHERDEAGDWSDWHVYNSLWSGGLYAGAGEERGSAKRSMQANAQMVLDEFDSRYNHGWWIEGTPAYNPAWSEITAPKWSPDEFQYIYLYQNTSEQYKNGVCTVVFDAKLTGIWTSILGLGSDLTTRVYSQSMARGSVRGIK